MDRASEGRQRTFCFYSVGWDKDADPNVVDGDQVEPLPVGAVFLLRHDSRLDRPQLRPISAAEASARLYITALNALAHADRGLDAVLGLAAQVPCYSLITAGLPATCELLLEAFDP